MVDDDLHAGDVLIADAPHVHEEHVKEFAACLYCAPATSDGDDTMGRIEVAIDRDLYIEM